MFADTRTHPCSQTPKPTHTVVALAHLLAAAQTHSRSQAPELIHICRCPTPPIRCRPSHLLAAAQIHQHRQAVPSMYYSVSRSSGMIVFGGSSFVPGYYISFCIWSGGCRIASCYLVAIMGQGDAGGRARLAYLAGDVSVQLVLCIATRCAAPVPGWTASPCPVTFYCAGGQNVEPTNP